MTRKQLSLKFFKDIAYWDSHQGQGVKVDGSTDLSRWSTDASHLNIVLPLVAEESAENTLVSYLQKHLCRDIKADWLNITDGGIITFTLVEDGEGVPVNTHSSTDPQEQLYICDYSIQVELQEVLEYSAKELSILFPNAERSFSCD